MNWYRIPLFLLIFASGVYAAEGEQSTRESAYQTEYDSKERAAERHVVLRQAFDGCSTSKSVSTEQLYQLPSDLEEYIADFTYGAEKLKFLAHAMQPLIPAVITFQDRGLFHKLTFPRISGREPQTYAAASHYSYLNGERIVPIEEMRSIARTPNSFCVYYYPGATIYKVCPSNFKKLYVCKMVELNHCMQLYALRAQKLQEALVAKQTLEGPGAELTLSEEEEATARIVLTPEQQALHSGLPEHMKQCLTTNYKFQLQ